MQTPSVHRPVVHLELRTANLARACAFYRELLGWRPDPVRTSCGAYMALDLGLGVGGGVAEIESERPLWVPYAEVGNIDLATERAAELGAEVLVEPREGPAGWRSTISTPAAGAIALWQSKG